MAPIEADKWVGVKRSLAADYAIDLPAIEKSAQRIFAQSKNAPKASTTEIYWRTDQQSVPRQVIPPLDALDVADSPHDSRIEPRMVEQNIEEMMRLLDFSTALRRDYAGAAKDYLEAKIKLEEFFRLDEIHRLEVEAGLYEMPWKESEDQLAALDRILPALSASQTAIDAELATGSFSKAQIDDFVNTSAELTGHSVREKSATEAKALSSKAANYRSAIEVQQWKRVSALGLGELERLRAQRAIEQRRVRYLQKEVTFKQTRTAVARDLSYERLAYHAQPGGALNHKETLAGLRALFQSYLPRLMSRVLAVRQGLAEYYRIEIPLPDLSQGRIIEALSLWAGKAQEELSIRRRSERIAVLSLSLSELVSSRWRDRLKRGVELTITPADLPVEGVLRGFNLEMVGDTRRPATIQAGPVSPQGHWAPLTFGRLAPRDSAGDLRQAYAEAVWNHPASGKWYFRSVKGLSTSIEDIHLVLWVATT